MAPRASRDRPRCARGLPRPSLFHLGASNGSAVCRFQKTHEKRTPFFTLCFANSFFLLLTCHKETPRAPKEAPRGPKEHPELPRSTQEHPRSPQELPKSSQGAPMEVPKSTQELPRSTQEPSRLSLPLSLRSPQAAPQA